MKKSGISSLTLRMFAMFFMLLDHMWATVVTGNQWMTDLGRLAFPIFAFLIAEGYAHTGSFGRYIKRLLLFALISEIPFNLMMSGSVIFPFHQNVIWTFIIALFCIRWAEKLASKGGRPMKIISWAIFALLGFILGTIGMTDYGGAGVLTVMMFRLFRGRRWQHFALQAAGMYFINCVLITGQDIPLMLMGHEFFFPQQGFALFSLLLIWLYNGERGRNSKLLQYSFYAFYPVHMLILALTALLM